MLFSARLPLSSLIDLCRALRHSLGAGLSLTAVFRQQATSGPPPIRPVALAIHQDLQRGENLETALQQHSAAFPPLFLALVNVGEQSGRLPEIFGELERYFVLQQRLRRQFRTQSFRPLLQFFLSILVIAGLIWVLGLIADRGGVEPLDPLGIGLTGGRGALAFLAIVFGTLAAIYVAYRFLISSGRHSGVALLLLRLPVVGPCVEALALMRFCLALRLTLETAMPLPDALALSLRATDHGAFTAAVPAAQKAVRAGRDLTESLGQLGLFREEFLHVIAVAEESGQLPEVMQRQAVHYQEEAERRLKGLTRAAAFLVWLVTAAFIVWAIFRIFINVYLTPLSGI